MSSPSGRLPPTPRRRPRAASVASGPMALRTQVTHSPSFRRRWHLTGQDAARCRDGPDRRCADGFPPIPRISGARRRGRWGAQADELALWRMSRRGLIRNRSCHRQRRRSPSETRSSPQRHRRQLLRVGRGRQWRGLARRTHLATRRVC